MWCNALFCAKQQNINDNFHVCPVSFNRVYETLLFVFCHLMYDVTVSSSLYLNVTFVSGHSRSMSFMPPVSHSRFSETVLLDVCAEVATGLAKKTHQI